MCVNLFGRLDPGCVTWPRDMVHSSTAEDIDRQDFTALNHERNSRPESRVARIACE